MREPDTCVARSAFDYGAAGTEFAFRLSRQNNKYGGAILYRTARIEEFGLAENFTARILTCAL